MNDSNTVGEATGKHFRNRRVHKCCAPPQGTEKYWEINGSYVICAVDSFQKIVVLASSVHRVEATWCPLVEYLQPGVNFDIVD